MSDQQRCPQCGAILVAASAGGLCPQCLLRVGLDAETHADVESNDDGSEEDAGREFGPYKTVRLLGRGGMGTVYLAEQQRPIRRQVALKVIKPGMDSREVIARFESERQALALMDHPNIARVFDAGTSHDGRPYFAMEYVPGIPITEYCDRNRLTNRERLELFIPVCQAVQHAHQKGTIHRDLKPSNVLVAVQDGLPVPKVIDFGVAKAINQKLIDQTLITGYGILIGTPAYMSPEQAASSGEDIDTRTDVYSLGIIFYELLAGAPPLDLRKIALEEFLRRLRETEPPKPSTRIRTQDPAQSTELARRRHTEPLALARKVQGDLDSIALKALEKDRSRRYGSPSDFAADIERYLRNEAVLAVPPSATYRARKFARRHRATLATTCAFALVLLMATGVSIWQSVRATRQRDRADAEAAVAQAINDFLRNDVLAQASIYNQPSLGSKPDPDLKMRTALDRAAARISGKFDRQPEVEAAIRETIGETYEELGLYSEARKQLERALELLRKVRGATDPKTLRITGRLGALASAQDKLSEAEALLGQALEVQRRVLGFEHRDTVNSVLGLVVVYRQHGRFAEAEVLLSQALDASRRRGGAENRATLAYMGDLAFIYAVDGKYDQAEALGRQTLEIRRRLLDPGHPEMLQGMNILITAYIMQGKYARAEDLSRQTLETSRNMLGSENAVTLVLMDQLTAAYAAQAKYVQAEALGRQILEIRRRLTPEHPETLQSMSMLANVYSTEGNYAQAETLYGQIQEISRRTLGEESIFFLLSFLDIADMYQRQGKYALAEHSAAQGLARLRKARGSQGIAAMGAAAYLALARVSQRKFAQSEPLVREAVEFDRRKRPDQWPRFRDEALLGASLSGQKKYADAEPLLLEGYRGMMNRKDRVAVSDWYHLDLAREWIVQLYQAWGKPEEAAEWRKK